MKIPPAKTAVATPNIALIKYWGRRDSNLNLPFNSSLSMTLDYSLNTVTTVSFSDKIASHRMTIDGKVAPLDQRDEKLLKTGIVIDEMLRLGGYGKDMKVVIVSKNSFPGGAGIASSASGGAALVYALNESLDLELEPRELSILARKISGSACRSMFGGLVMWKRGRRKDGLDSYAEMIFDSSHWTDLVDVVAIVSEEKKSISSSEGHDITSSTSPLFKVRPKLAEHSISAAIDFVKRRDFQGLGEIVMRDSNNMHAAMMDSWPPIMYLRDPSREIIDGIEELNSDEGRIVAAYTFDAGPNPHILTQKSHLGKVETLLNKSRSVKKLLKSVTGRGPKITEEVLQL